MNATRFHRAAVAVVGLAVLPLALSACSSDSSDSKDSGDKASSAAPQAPDTSDDAAAGMGDKPFGSACASVPKEGAGSFDGMSKDPVATAASNNPALSTLVTAVKKAGLVDTLNNAENITVFAPTNDAFAKLPKADLDKVLADKAMLTKILTYHVVGEKLTTKQLASGTYPTLEKSTLSTSGSGEAYKVNDTANVVCGNVPTANATVNIIDTVLMPKM
ncbi:fasciclin domain-containing protein [Streptomyces sp. NPDC088725]|uniref:fasciclin domain-containing protein n=1 Tax=Streptomyces sp. NPDC088725 TaxID=3365873 RepID=UPI00381CD2BB